MLGENAPLTGRDYRGSSTNTLMSRDVRAR
jgi:hypothetical protein